MRRMRQWIVITVVGTAFLSLATTPCWAGHAFKRLSKNHLLFGVSQFLAGNINSREATPLKLFNPTPVTQVVAALFYERESEGPQPGGNAAQFRACLVRLLTPHGALQLNLDFVATNPHNRHYVEVISAPVTPVKREEDEHDDDSDSDDDNEGLRLADGLGIRGTATLTLFASVPLSMVHPELFTLPADEVVPGQRQDAIDCLCDGLITLGLDLDVFEDFGVDCLLEWFD